ncbi:hydroxymethylbilane synthase [Marinisporobacter balticus]|uniref:Porphobilinogen deaminase n=1 Tax=Marinisporobacter balticus TaxID=2018667 RepID=A0A4R2L9P3_9FIRM|nr:hydroxymethylbilane synthase [Marinisporobacter balticus]TCO79488.1 hydroxymethylbilane synthase [Marinisporobacter balticus]
MTKKKIIVGSRASDLALNQTYWVIDRLKEKFPHFEYKVVKIKTIGDKILDRTLDKIGGKGLFVKEIEAALLNHEIDLAVHSMKDVPTEMVEDLSIGAITDREDVRDVLISKDGKALADLKKGAKIGTSSLRRAAQILAFRSDFVIEPIRGNIKTRIEKIESMNLDGIILAAAGILRMGWGEQISEYIDPLICTPAVGQGALGIQIRKEDTFIASIVKELNNEDVETTVKAERSFMNTLNGGCHVPIGAYARVKGDTILMTSVIASPNGTNVIKLQDTCDREEGEQLGIKMAKISLEKGGDEILKNIEVGE